MKKPVAALLVIVLIIVGVLVWWFSDTQVIKRQSEQFAETLTIISTDGKTARASKTQDFSSLLAPSVHCSIDISDYEADFGHDDLETAHQMMVHNCESSSAQINSMEITGITDTQATVQADISLALTELSGRKHSENCTVELIWKKNESGNWQIESITINRS